MGARDQAGESHEITSVKAQLAAVIGAGMLLDILSFRNARGGSKRDSEGNDCSTDCGLWPDNVRGAATSSPELCWFLWPLFVHRHITDYREVTHRLTGIYLVCRYRC